MKGPIEARVIGLIANKSGLATDQIQVTHDLAKDLGLDSLHIVEFRLELEQEFGIQISDREAKVLHTVKDFIDFVSRKLNRDS